MVEVAIYEGIRNFPGIEIYRKQFKLYKETGTPPLRFGKDASYSWPSTAVDAELRHIHVTDLPAPWVQSTPQENRTTDSHLIYTRGYFHQDNYLILAFLALDAHASAEKVTFMASLADIAEQFRSKY